MKRGPMARSRETTDGGVAKAHVRAQAKAHAQADAQADAEADTASRVKAGSAGDATLKAEAVEYTAAAAVAAGEDAKPPRASSAKSEAKAQDASGPAPQRSAPAKKVPPRKGAARKASGKSAPAGKIPAPKTAAKRKAAPASSTPMGSATAPGKAPAKSPIEEQVTASVTELKEKIMATKNPDFTAAMNKSMTDSVTDMQSKAQEAYEKGTAMVGEMTEVAKGNVEAFVESGRIMAIGMQGMGKTYADEAKSHYETLTADLKEMAAVKSPTELLQLQGKIMRRNFDLLVASTSKNSEKAMKLANDAFAPVSGRMNATVETMSKVS